MTADFLTRRLKPNLLVVGAAKAATTSLHDYLGQHPQIFMSPDKEPHYFTKDWGVQNWDDYLALFRDAAGRDVIGESSTGYLYSEESPEWIASVLGKVKIIILLRQPARRALSQYAWMAREGYEDATTFAEALAREPSRISDASFRRVCIQFYPDYLYFTSGLYATQVRRYMDVFGTANVRVYLFEDFIADPAGTCRDIFRFLGVADGFTPRITILNKGRIPASVRLQWWLRVKAEHQLSRLPERRRRKIIRKLGAWNIRLGRKPRLDKKTEALLMDRYREDVLQLQSLLNCDLSRWFVDE